MRKILLTAVLVAGLSSLPASAASTGDAEESTRAIGQDQAAAYNWFDPATWGAGTVVSAPGATMAFNPAHPASWAKIMDPKSHVNLHMAFTNPANYAQFMQPQFYLQFMNPENWFAWMNPANYAVFMNPTTYMWWMTPAAYVHGMDPSNYMQLFNPANYAAFMNPMTYSQWMNPAAYTFPGGSSPEGVGFDAR
jgi:hypothetical protein